MKHIHWKDILKNKPENTTNRQWKRQVKKPMVSNHNEKLTRYYTLLLEHSKPSVVNVEYLKEKLNEN